MLTLDEIKQFYTEDLHSFDRFLLREYLQYKILEIVFDSAYGNKLCFIGGTCLRIVHNNNRFSEDLDFDNFNLSKEDFEAIADIIKRQLELDGYEIEMRNVFKGAFHCYIRFPKILHESGLSGHLEEKILIQLDTEPQHFEFEPEAYILNKFDVFTSILTTPIDILLAQKFYAICNRNRPKGRDFFDVLFLLPKTKPNYNYLQQKMDISDGKALKEKVLEVCAGINFQELTQDVSPFLFHSKDEKRIALFADYIKQEQL